MDLNTVNAIILPKHRRELASLSEGDALLAGGTGLFSEPQPDVTRLIDLTTLGWEPITIMAAGLEIAATCTFARLEALTLPSGWHAAPLFRQCCRALLGSFKVWNQATVGGNLCLALPAGPMAALFSALDATCTIWMPDGGERRLPTLEFVTGASRNALRPGEVLRAIHVPAVALSRRAAFRQISLSPLGRSGALLIGTRGESDFALTVTAATARPVQLSFVGVPEQAALAAALDSVIPEELYHDDVHGRPDWRRHVTHLLAREIREELWTGCRRDHHRQRQDA